MKRISYLWALCTLLVLDGCVTRPRKPALRASDYRGIIRLACVGDSITYGAGVENRVVNCYPTVLGRLLGPRFDVRNFGVSGATLLKGGDLSYWKLKQFRELADFDPQVIILALGTNDSKPQNWAHGGEFSNDLRAMLDRFDAFPAHPKVWLCLPPPVYETKWGISEATVSGRIIPTLRQVAMERNVPTIDLHQALSDRPGYFSDGIHPNATGSGMMAMTVFTALKGR